MATVTLRPDGETSTQPGTTHNGVNFRTAVNDNSDATWIEIDAANVGFIGFSNTTFTLPALAQVRSLTPRARVALATAGTRVLNLKLYFGSWQATSPISPTTTPTTYTGAPSTTGYYGAPFTQYEVDFMGVSLSAATAAAPILRIYEVYLDLVYNEAPVATVTAPAGTVTTPSGVASATWTYSDPESDAQERYQAKIFSAAQYGIGGFNPETSPYTWSSGEVFSSAATATLPGVANGTYRMYVKVADVGSSGRYGNWVYSAFVLNVVVPPTPTLVATAEAGSSRVKLDATTGTYATAPQLVSIERSNDSGVTWTTVRGAFEIATASLATLTAYDYEMPRGVSIRYRARVVSDPAGGRVVSADSAVATLTLGVSGWWLKDPLAPARNIAITVAAFPITQKEPQQTYEPLGRTQSVVVSDGVKGIEGSMQLWLKTKAAYDAIQLILSGGRTLRLDDALGRSWYIKVGTSHSYDLLRAAPAVGETTAIRHLHRVTLPFVEVGRPSGA